jgi:hypothetical protein
MAFKLIESAQAHWRAVNAPHLVALGRAGAEFENGKLVERPDESGGDQQDRVTRAAMRPAGMSVSGNFRVRFGCLTGWGCMDGLRHARWAGR